MRKHFQADKRWNRHLEIDPTVKWLCTGCWVPIEKSTRWATRDDKSTTVMEAVECHACLRLLLPDLITRRDRLNKAIARATVPEETKPSGQQAEVFKEELPEPSSMGRPGQGLGEGPRPGEA